MSEEDEYLKQQRLAFEAQFGSLEDMGFDDKTKTVQKSDDESASSDESASENGNGSENEEDGSYVSTSENIIPATITPKKESLKVKKPKIIKFQGPSDSYVAPSKKELKILRSGKTLVRSKAYDQDESQEVSENENDEADNLKNDLELQRFLQESHLLSAFSNTLTQPSGADLTLQTINNNDVTAYMDDQLMGKARSRTLEMRLKNLSSTNGHDKKVNRLEKVPINMRKGLVAKHQKRIARYEKDAKEGGIVLSKVKKGEFRKIEATYKRGVEKRIGTNIKSHENARNAKRTRGLRINSVGRSTRNGLIISKEDIARINGSSGGRRDSSKKSKGRR
ncbi:hypothetical protein TBLA_0J01540 [Henningerozyma blattae CBS 6284]|uniref:Protein FAF1 n=1 Tax=Henningerozyma blattae (strain ATCC 34711 / CBS 6284 / DSM 70876 / NBRC 10599 / NRRL Y-10934 / UCD 77-7) TaxID=1071380 RepID=I2H9U8_HENB6|nr:hypothetical protein TBLA_0J01540 [Tetrapisispora blattae CBS 6284]CCH63150.1 hypothetical protein TBLA_0J01540 [Tetrapisispora blattae CBS 6284]